MANLRTILERKNSHASYRQDETRETGPRGYREAAVRPVVLANRIYKRRRQLRRDA
ncbi:hypothetical protein [Streptomyces ipomoeae]|uniref:hypothetical protein n=1 Tax=Streptomyces ipomoeae TaxID=103232 RepID=UPI0029B0A81B|nr:hypothetical protein [Streptomyces ipomoeae]MDX2697233.1 hypothetical protein [Streptomyces ipomoeae]